MKYERLTTRKVVALLNIIDEKSVTVQGYLRLAELEDKIESGELIVTQLKDTSDQELEFFAKHNKSVRRLFADELKVCLQADLERGDITQEAYDIFVDKINYCLGEVEE